MWRATQWSRSAAISAAVRSGALVAIAFGALIAAFALTWAQTKSQPVAAEDSAVLAADTALGDALRAGDKGAARRLLALQFSLVDADGATYARKEILADLKRVAAASATDIKVRNYGLAAAITGRHRSAHDADAFFLDIWVKQKGAWRALLIQEVPVEVAAPSTTPAASSAEQQPKECQNPCQTIPYRVRSPAEQDVVNTFQAIMKAVVAHDANAWRKNVADEFIVYASGQPPMSRADRIATIESQKEKDTPVTVGEVQTMRLAVYGDGAVMTTTEAAPDQSHPPYRALRIWARRNGQWQMTISAHTDIK